MSWPVSGSVSWPDTEAVFEVALHYYADETDEGGFFGVLTPGDGPAIGLLTCCAVQFRYDRRDVQFFTAAIGEDKKITPADIRKRRRNITSYGISVKLFINDDPHAYLLLPHQREKDGIEPFLEPTLSHCLLLSQC